MKQTSGSATRTRAATKRPPMAVRVKGDGRAHPDGQDSSEADTPRDVRIHEAAYALYQARGCVDGHDLDDWLAAEAAVGREVQGARAGESFSEH
ncbi:MAG: DUF2934 domain-containing protein [Hydrogenophaga sp.]|nr:DUF2934 domain-containing protein [Hydrogenophaga sp.]